MIRDNEKIIQIATWGILLAYAIVIFSKLVPSISPNWPVAVFVFLPLLFMVVHGVLLYRFRDVLFFIFLSLVMSNFFENMNIAIEFPVGNYHYANNALGDIKVFLVPAIIGFAYVGMEYISWMLAQIVLCDTKIPIPKIIAIPMLGSLFMLFWNLTFEPWASTVRRWWVWHEGGFYFGAPLSNFIGWYVTVFIFFQCFAIYMRRKGGETPHVISRRASLIWLPVIVVYGLTAVHPILRFIMNSFRGTVVDQSGVVWGIVDMYATCALVATLFMGGAVVIAILKLSDVTKWSPNLREVD